MQTHDTDTAVHLRIEGRVQGVWFRGWTRETAEALGLAGWVRNRRDGTVEALVEGPGDAIEQMIAACHEGPPHARVARVDVAEVAVTGRTGFSQKPTL